MKNILKYYYNLEPENIHQNNNNYQFSVNGKKYCFFKCDDISNLEDLYTLNITLLNIGYFCNQIILNVQDSIVTLFNGVPYILNLLTDNSDDEVTIKNIRDFSGLIIEHYHYYPKLDKSDWYNLWIKKIDYLEYQISQIGKKYPVIRNSINYYVGLAENSISLLPKADNKNKKLVVSHCRVGYRILKKEFYNPTKFILDVRIRDLSEYYKEKFFFIGASVEELKTELIRYNLSSDEAILFFARMLFPTYYFDCCDDVLFEKEKEVELFKYIKKINDYENFLKGIYLFFRTRYTFPDIEWLEKKSANLY